MSRRFCLLLLFVSLSYVCFSKPNRVLADEVAIVEHPETGMQFPAQIGLFSRGVVEYFHPQIHVKSHISIEILPYSDYYCLPLQVQVGR